MGAHVTSGGMRTVVRDESEKPLRMIGISWDVTEERIREEKLSEALSREKELAREALAGDRAKSEFLAVMSHEIRTPMNGILGFAQLLSQDPSLTSDSRNYAQIIMQSGEALLRILDDALDFSRLEAGRVQIEKSRFSPREMLKSIRALLVQRASEKELKLHIVVDDGIPEHLEGDAGRLRQVLLNLVGNGIKFTERGCVTLGLRPSPGRSSTGALTFEFSVKDTGLGITPGQIERIFKPFTQADSGNSRRYGGTGLGLSISRSLTELMGGTLTVQSQPGQGSEFFVAVPLDVPEQSSDIATGTPPEPLDVAFANKHPLRILLVEDDRENLKLVLTLIRRLGYEPLAARNGREAVEIYQREQPSCLLMDLRMLEMDGIEATEKIRALEMASGNGKRAFIAALTADVFPAGRQRCIDAGMNAYLNKPVKLSALAEVLTKACDFADGYS